MTVAMTADLVELAQKVRKKGFRVVTYGAYRGAIDAVVYSGQLADAPAMQQSNFSENTGVLMIPAGNQNVDYIIQCLTTRTYSALL